MVESLSHETQKQLEMTLFTLIKEHFPKGSYTHTLTRLFLKALCQSERRFPL